MRVVMFRTRFAPVVLVFCLALGAVGCPRDTLRPRVVLSSAVPDPAEVTPIPVTVAFSESVSGFVAADVETSNATIQNFTGSGARYYFDLIPLAEGRVTADVSADVAYDAAGNGNRAAAQFSRTYAPAPAWQGFADPNLEAAVRAWFETAGIPLGDMIRAADLVNVGFTELDASDRGITDLTGLEAATDLVTLNLFANNVSDLGPLSPLVNLQVLNLGCNQVQNLEPLSTLTGLVSLELGLGNPVGNPEVDITAADANRISDISPLSTLTNLTYLNLAGNADLADISTLAALPQLEQVWLGNCTISDFSPLAAVTELQGLAIDNCGFTNADIAYIAELENLSLLVITREDALSDITGLAGLNPRIMYLRETGVSDISTAANWTNLDWIDVSLSPVSDISALAGLTGLKEVRFEGCLLSDISVLAGLGQLEAARLANNQIQEITPLLDNPNFRDRAYLDITGNPLSEIAVCEDVPALRDRLDEPDYLVSDQICHPMTLTITTSGAGQTIPEPSTYAVAFGESVQIVAYPAAGTGCAFSEWRGDATGTGTVIDVVMDSDKSIEAVFVEGGDWTLTIQTQGSGSGSVFPEPGEYSYFDGQEAFVALNAAQSDDGANGYFAGWTGDLTGYHLEECLSMTGDRTVAALFEETGFELELNVNGIGTTWPQPGQYRLAAGAEVPVAAQETDPIRHFSHWEGCTDSTDPSITIIMDRDKAATAVFPWNQDLTIDVDGDGTTDPAPGTLDLPWRETVTVEVHAQEGWYLDHWDGNFFGGELVGRATGDPAPPVLNVLMDMPHTLTAVFMAGDWTLTVNVVGNGATSLGSGTQTFPDGRVVVVEPLYSADAYFDHWEGDIGTADPYRRVVSLPMDSDKTVAAVFADAVHTLTVRTVGDGRTYPEPGVCGFGEGNVATVFAFPLAGSTFARWEGDGAGTRPAADIVMDRNKTVTAVFEEVPDQPLTFDDANVEMLVRQEIDKPEGDILPGDVADLVVLEPTYRGVETLAGIEVLTTLTRFNCYGNGLVDIGPVGALTNLLHTDMASNRITDVTSLSGLPFLEDLTFGANQVNHIGGLVNLPNLIAFVAFENDIEVIAALAAFTRLRTLDLTGNQVGDVSALSGLTGLQVLRLGNNQVGDIAALSGLKAAQILKLDGNPVADISPLAGLIYLSTLDLSGCQVSDVGALAALPALSLLSLNGDPVSDLAPLVDNMDFAEGDVLYVLDCPLSQEAVCTQIPFLEARGVEVWSNATCPEISLTPNDDDPMMILPMK